MYLKLARRETLDSLHQAVKSNLRRYVNVDEHYLVVMASDVILSYFQEKFPTMHYDVFVGDNGSGKILKFGYASGGTVPKTDFPNGKRSQGLYNVYGIKWRVRHHNKQPNNNERLPLLLATTELYIRHPSRLEFDSNDILYVTEPDNGRIQKFDTTGQFVGTIAEGQLSFPVGIDLDSSDNVYVACV